ncbi:MAG: hypothetical protein NC453_27930 [Muribaculum sp.]|nr:hypothetical protein [Muribaculum sp.]
MKTAIKNLALGAKFIHNGTIYTIKMKSPIIGGDESGECRCFHPEYKVHQA